MIKLLIVSLLAMLGLIAITILAGMWFIILMKRDIKKSPKYMI